MTTIINFFKNLFISEQDNSYIGLSSFSNINTPIQKRNEKLVKKNELSLTELLRKN